MKKKKTNSEIRIMFTDLPNTRSVELYADSPLQQSSGIFCTVCTQYTTSRHATQLSSVQSLADCVVGWGGGGASGRLR